MDSSTKYTKLQTSFVYFVYFVVSFLGPVYVRIEVTQFPLRFRLLGP